MAKPPRDRTSFGSNTYFVTVSTWGQRRILQSERMVKLFIETLAIYRQQRKVLLHEFVVMPDHVHLILTPTDGTLEKAMQFVKGGFSYRVKKELELSTEIWERGYVDHRIRDAGDYAKHVEYVRLNPVRAKLANVPEEYRYSSAHSALLMDECPSGLKPQSSLIA